MRIELKENRIAIILSEAESRFLTQKIAATGQKNVSAYIKARVLKALELKGFEDSAIVSLANNFNLAKIKHVSTELSKRQASTDKYSSGENEEATIEDDVFISDEDVIAQILEETIEIGTKEVKPIKQQADIKPARINKEIVDDLLEDLLDKDLLAGRLPVKGGFGPPAKERKDDASKKHANDSPRAPKSRKHGIKHEKDEN